MNTVQSLAMLMAGVLIATGSFAQQPATPLSLRQCVETALENNLEVKISDLDMQRSEVNRRGAVGQLLPAVSADISHSLRQGRSIDIYTNSYTNQSNTTANYELYADLTLFNGFRWFNNLKASEYAVEAGRMRLQQQKDVLTLDVVLAYLQVLTNLDLLAQFESQATVTEKQVQRLQIMNEQGAIKPSDLYDMKGQMAANKLSIITATNNLNSSRLRLAQLMNVPYNENLNVEKLSVEAFDMQYGGTPDSIYNTALQQLAQIKNVDLVAKGAAKAVASAKGGLFPRVYLNGGVNSNYSGAARDTNGAKIQYYDQISNNYSTYAGIGINIPFLNRFQARNQLSLNRLNLKQAEYTAQTTRIQLRQNIERDYLNMDATRNRYQALIDQVASYNENFRAAEVRFNAGASTSVDYLIARNKLDNSNIDLIVSRYDYLLRTRILDYYQGKMLW